MNILSRLLESRRRRRTVSTLDPRWRKALRALESGLKRSLLKILGGMLRPVERALPLDVQNVRSVLILRYDALGDAILATPVWRSLKAANPNIRIGVAGSARNISLLSEDEDIDQTFIFSRAFSIKLLREIRKARRTKWEVVLNLFFHDKTRGAIFARLAAPGAASVTMVRDGVKDVQIARLYTKVGIRPKELTPMVNQNMMAMNLAIRLSTNSETIVPSLPEKFSRNSNSLAHLAKYIVLHVEASQDYKEWGLTNALELTEQLLGAYPDVNIVWTSSGLRAEECRRILAKLGSPRASYVPTPMLEDITTIIRRAVAVVSPDTSIVHIAAAEHVPLVGLYMEPNEFLPFTELARVVFAPTGKTASAIPVGQVFEAIREFLGTPI